MGRVTVRVPATSANLGPGYDAFGLALGIYNTFSAEHAEEWSIEVEGTDAEHLKTDASNPVAAAMMRAFADAGRTDLSAHLRCENAIPTGRGLGSSAAAIVGGYMLGNALVGQACDADTLLERATEIEGHPDNVAAAIHGGFTISAMEEDRPSAFCIPVTGGVAAVLVVSRLPYQTKRARRLLPAQVPHADAAFNAGRAALLATGLALGREDLISMGAHDRLHESYRFAALPDAALIISALREAGADAAMLSGAGPTVIGLVCAEDDDSAVERGRGVAARCGAAVTTIDSYRAPAVVTIDRTGASV